MRIGLDPQKLVPAEKKHPQNKTPQKLTPFSQIKNSAFNRLVPLERYSLDNDFPLEKATRAVNSTEAIQYIRLARMDHLKKRRLESAD